MKRREFVKTAAIAPVAVPFVGALTTEKEPSFEDKVQAIAEKWRERVKSKGYTDEDIKNNIKEAIELRNVKAKSLVEEYNGASCTVGQFREKVAELDEYFIKMFNEFLELWGTGTCSRCRKPNMESKGNPCIPCELQQLEREDTKLKILAAQVRQDFQRLKERQQKLGVYDPEHWTLLKKLGLDI
jgi:hypothetical protein